MTRYNSKMEIHLRSHRFTAWSWWTWRCWRIYSILILHLSDHTVSTLQQVCAVSWCSCFRNFTSDKFVGLLSLVFPSIACTRLQPILLPSTSVCSPDSSCMQTCGETQQHVQWYITGVLSIIFDLLNFATVIWKHSCFTH